MRSTTISPYYLQVAQDIAARVVKGEFQAGQRIYGRSMMASEYNTSPETIRRAFRLLSDMTVLEVKPQSGTVVLSEDNARRYIKNFEAGETIRSLRADLRKLTQQYTQLNAKFTSTMEAFFQSQSAFSESEFALPSYEVPVSSNSSLIGKSIGELKFWQSTGGTIAAIRRGRNLILSPGPYAELYAGDVIVLVGTPAAAEAASRLVEEQKEEMHDPI